MKFLQSVLLLAAAVLAGCTSVSPRTSVSVGYYDVGGTTFRQLDDQIALHGPFVEGVGKAVAATSINMRPDIRFRETDQGCVVSRSSIKVDAKVTLPRLKDRRKAKADLRPAFSNIERYAREHEAVHVAIADKYAEEAERAIASLGPEESCGVLQAKATRTFEKIMVQHRAEQLEFDREEKRRFEQDDGSA